MKNFKNSSKKKSLFIAAIALLSTNFSYAQLTITPTYGLYLNNQTYDNWTNATNWAFSLDDDYSTPYNISSFSWWQNGGRNLNDLMMTLTRPSSASDNQYPELRMHGYLVTQNREDNSSSWDNLTMYADGTKSYIQSNGDDDGMLISSNTGNKITVGDDNDAVTIKNTTLTGNTIINNSNGVASISSNTGAAGSWISFRDNTESNSPTTKGLLSAGANTMEFYTGTDVNTREKVLSVGSNLEGNTKFFQKNITFNYKTQNDLTQVSINSDNKVLDCALTVAGATHIGPQNANFSTFNYANNIGNYLLWVEKGIVTEDLAFASINQWRDKVFADDYKLSSLSDLEAYLKTNRHLPGFRSEAEVIKNGYSAKEFNLSVLQQVEELVLYTIEQDKQIKQLKEQVASYKNLENEVRLIKEKLNTKN